MEPQETKYTNFRSRWKRREGAKLLWIASLALSGIAIAVQISTRILQAAIVETEAPIAAFLIFGYPMTIAVAALVTAAASFDKARKRGRSLTALLLALFLTIWILVTTFAVSLEPLWMTGDAPSSSDSLLDNQSAMD